MESVKVLAITQARVGSTRFPAKILKEISGISMLELHLKRILKSSQISKIMVATTRETGVESILDIADKCNVEYYQGSTSNVLDRFYQTAIEVEPEWVVRLTSDCPLIDAELIDNVIEFAITNDLDYCSNCMVEMYPDGQDIEVFKFWALEEAWKNAKSDIEKEHVSLFIHDHSTYKGGSKFSSDVFPAVGNYNHIRMTVDEEKDFEAIKVLVDELGMNATWKEYTDLYKKLEVEKINGSIIRNEGYLKSLKKNG